MTWSGQRSRYRRKRREDGAGDDGDDEAEEASCSVMGSAVAMRADTDWFEGPNVPDRHGRSDHVVAVANDQRIVEAVLDAVGLQLVGCAFRRAPRRRGSIGESDIRKKTRTVTPNTMMGSQSRRLPISRSRLFTRSPPFCRLIRACLRYMVCHRSAHAGWQTFHIIPICKIPSLINGEIG